MKKYTGVKLLPLLLLMCSFAYAQSHQNPKQKKPKTKGKHTLVEKLKRDTAVMPHIDSTELEADESAFDPMDSVKLKRSPSALKSKVTYNARDSIIYSDNKKKIYLYGEGKVLYEDMVLNADYIQIDISHNIVTALPTKDTSGKWIGQPVFKQGQQSYSASRIDYNFKSKKGNLSEFKTREGEGFVRGTQVIKNADNEFGIRNSTYTTCDADTPHFAISAARLKVIPEKKVVGLWPNLVIMGINTPLIFPFAIFPLKKGQSSGIVIPQYGSDISRGFFLRGGGYYFGLGEHADLQLTSDIYSNLSWGGHAVFKYSNRYHYNGNLFFNYANNQFGLPEDPLFHQQKDFQLNWTHMQDGRARPGTNFSANVNLVSANYLALNSYNPSNIISNQMTSSISFSKSMGGGKYNMSSNARVSQNVSTRDISISFPDLAFSVSSFTPFKSKFKPTADTWYEYISASYNSQFRNEFSSKDTLLFASRSNSDFTKYYDTTGKYGMVHNIPVQASFKVMKYFTFSTRVDFTDYMYTRTIRKEIDSSNKELPPAVVTRYVDGFENAITYRPSVSLSTRFYGMKQFKSGPISAIRHVVTPTIGLSYTPDFSDPIYGYYKSYKDMNGNMVKYSIFEQGLMGTPGSGRQGNVNFSLDNNLETKYWHGKDSARKEEKLTLLETFSASGSYNMLADSFNLSMIGLSARTKLFKNISISASSTLDPYVNKIYNVNGYNIVQRINRFALADQSIPGTLTNASIGLSAGFNRDMLKGKPNPDKKGYEGELKYLNDFPSEYIDFNIPWSLMINYTVGFNKYAALNNPSANSLVQTLNYSGDFNLTKKWKIAYSSGYDFMRKDFSFTSINITRDLHCWEFKFDWIPFGPRQSFLFTIHVKAAVLQELKQTKRREWYDRTI